MPSRCRCFRVLLVSILIILFSVGATAASKGSLVEAIDKALGDSVLAHGIQGVLIQSLDDGRTIYERNSDIVLLPASNFKIIVSSAALDMLGPDYRMHTRLYIAGEQTSDGLLKGDVVLVGGGDPVFRHADLQSFASKLKQAGIRTIEGNVVADDSRFDDIPLGWGWAWDDQPYYYAAQVSALNLNENVVEVWVRPGRKAGDPARVNVTPPTSYMIVRNECKTSASGTGKSLFVDRARGRNTIQVTGEVPLDYKPDEAEELITVEDPAVFTAHTLIEMLRREGIEVKGKATGGALPEGAQLLATHDSPPLSEMLALLNKPSDNLIAECLMKTLGAEIKGRGSFAVGEDAELEFMKKIGCDMTAVSITDGSGLSRQDYTSAANLVKILRYMARHKYAKIYMESLPIAGVDGTLRNRLKGTAAEGNVRAKTGYLSRVRAISGYVTAKSGEKLVFSILMNNHLCRVAEATEIQDTILKALAEWDGK